MGKFVSHKNMSPDRSHSKDLSLSVLFVVPMESDFEIDLGLRVIR